MRTLDFSARRWRPFAFAALLFSLAIVGACDAREITSSIPTAAPKPRGFDASPPAPAAIGSGSVSEGSPSTTLGTGPGSSWVIIRVSGSMTARHNPACDTLSANFPCQTGDPIGKFSATPSDEGPVQAWTQDGPWFPGKILLRDAGGGAIGLHHQANDGPVWAVLTVSNPVPSSSNPGTPPHSYILAGGYEVSAEAVPSPMQINGSDPDSTGARTYTIQPLYGLQIDQPVYVGWQFVPGDSISQYTIGAENAWDLWDCYGQGRTSCTWAPPPGVNGRMQVWTYMEGQLIVARGDYVLSPTSTPCVAANAIRHASTGARLDGSAAGCAAAGDSLEVRCSPTTVKRGSEVSCEATTTGLAPTDVAWSFVDSAGNTITGPREQSTWKGPMVVSGTVHLSARVRGEIKQDSQRIVVQARAWPDKFLSIAEQYGVQCATEANDCILVYPPRRSGDLAAGRPEPAVDWGRTAADRIDSIGSGPNSGWWFISGDEPIIPYDHYTIYYSALFDHSEDPWWRRDPGCTPTGVLDLLSAAQAHERKHYRYTSAAYGGTDDRKYNQQLERIMKFGGDRVAFRDTVVSSAIDVNRDILYRGGHDHNYPPGVDWIPRSVCAPKFPRQR